MTTEQARQAIITSIQDEYEHETGERPNAVAAEALLDRMCDAFVHKLEGAGAEYAVRDDMRTAEYLAHEWAGKESGEQLRVVIPVVKREREFARQREARAFFESLPLSGDQFRLLAVRVAYSHFKIADMATPEAEREGAIKSLTMQTLYGEYRSDAYVAASEATGGRTVWSVSAQAHI